MCGDPECTKCFPFNRPERLEEDPDYAYERWRDEQELARIAPPEDRPPREKE